MRSFTTLEEVIGRNEREARLLYVMMESGSETSIKVGITKDWKNLLLRQKNLQTGNPRLLVICLVVEFTEECHAHECERLVLDWFQAHRVRDSEWLVDVAWQQVLSNLLVLQSRRFSVVLPGGPID